MTARKPLLLLFALAAITSGPSSIAQSTDTHLPASEPGPALTNTCLITNDVDRLVAFYEQVLDIKAVRTGMFYAEFPSVRGVLAIFSAEAQEQYIPGSSEAAKNKSMILEFKVVDVEREYRRLGTFVKTWVKPPTTQPWGTRSLYFRDPDGNLVDFYTKAKAE
jgi:catechol 2,3-dioxygenase-like lactoylglutathione lyase family enzyme